MAVSSPQGRFTAALALELAPVRVNLIAAGFVDTPLSASLLGDRLEKRRNELRATLPIGRVVGPVAVGYERDIRPLFREKDVSSMSMAFDLASYNDVRANTDTILAKPSDGSMPCDGPWPEERVELFRSWWTPAVRQGGGHGVPG